MNVFVTGGTGLLGSHLLFRLSCMDFNIKAVKRKNSDLNNVKKVFSYYTDDVDTHFSKINWIEGDILDKEFIISSTFGVHIVYHLAAYVSYSVRQKIKKEMFRTNVCSTQLLIEACEENNIEKLCYVSSTSTLGSRYESGLINEQSDLELSKYTTSYAKSKFQAEKLVLEASEKGLRAVILNPSIIIGPGDWSRSSAKMILNIYKGLRFYPKGTIGFVDVRDVVNIICLLVEKNISGEKFIVSSENLSYQEVFTAIAKNLDINARLIPAPDFLLQIKWRIEFVKSLIMKSEPLITKETVSFSKKKIFFSNKKVINQLAYTFRPMPETIAYCVKKFKLDYQKSI